ncbi:MAG: NUDIX domain-containing protein [Patescibacteria group bacterium]|nr:NUDIX domain-containing protein [Patescibacteria group bacterium]
MKIRIAVVVMVFFEGRILIGKKRSDSSKSFAGKWHIPGGDLKSGEKLLTGACREISEETGLKIDSKKIRQIDVIGFLKPDQDEFVNILWLYTKLEAKTEKERAAILNAKPNGDLEAIKWILPKDIFCELDILSLSRMPTSAKVLLEKI